MVVTSHARAWDDEVTWSFGDRISALEKIEILIGYKIADRARGRGDAEADLAGFSS